MLRIQLDDLLRGVGSVVAAWAQVLGLVLFGVLLLSMLLLAPVSAVSLITTPPDRVFENGPVGHFQTFINPDLGVPESYPYCFKVLVSTGNSAAPVERCFTSPAQRALSIRTQLLSGITQYVGALALLIAMALFFLRFADELSKEETKYVSQTISIAAVLLLLLSLSQAAALLLVAKESQGLCALLTPSESEPICALRFEGFASGQEGRVQVIGLLLYQGLNSITLGLLDAWGENAPSFEFTNAPFIVAVPVVCWNFTAPLVTGNLLTPLVLRVAKGLFRAS